MGLSAQLTTILFVFSIYHPKNHYKIKKTCTKNIHKYTQFRQPNELGA